MKPLALLLAFLFLAATGSSQNVPIVTEHPVRVGAITRDAGLYNLWVGPHDLATIQAVNKYLVLLESDLAGKLSTMKGVSYQDRSATVALMREVHMSSGRDFDPSSGALRGLMQRLDYLIVIDAVDPSTATMRLIDVETGSVKGVENCSRHTGNSGCVTAMSHRLEAAGLTHAAATEASAEKRQEMMKIKPLWDDQVARYDAAKAFWDHIQSTISAGGHSLRPEIRTLLNGAATDVSTGRFAVEHLDTPTLKTTLAALTAKLDKLDDAR